MTRPTRKPKALNMFSTDDDLPLFSGAPVAADIQAFTPAEVTRAPELFPLPAVQFGHTPTPTPTATPSPQPARAVTLAE
jgi:hypothetical protein